MTSAQRVLALLLAIALTFGLLPAGSFYVCAAEQTGSGGTDTESGDVDIPVIGGDATEPSVDPDAPVSDSVVTVTHTASTVYPGEEITLTVSLSGDNAWTSFGYIPVMDSEAFEITGGEVLSIGQKTELWDFSAADGGLLYCSEPVTIEGGLFRFTVRIRNDAPAGQYAVTDAVALKSGGTKLPVSLNDAVITVGRILPQGVVDQGDCGEYLTWTLRNDRSLTISGTGAMYDYEKDQTPWHDYLRFIKAVHIEEGVSTVGDWSFYGCSELASVTVCQSVAAIGVSAFDSALAEVYYSATLAQWKQIAVADGNDWLLTARIHASDDKYCAHCGETVPWAEWIGATAPASGHYYLPNDLVGEQTQYLLIAEGTDVILDLCGHTYTAANGALFQINGTLSVVDSAQSGALTAPEGLTPETAGSLLYVTGPGGTFNLYSGTVRGGVAACGGNILADNYANINLCGGTVSGGTASYSGGNVCLKDGAMLYIDGCTVTGGKAEFGGNVSAYSGSGFAVFSGNVTAGMANTGRNVYITGNSESLTLFGACGGTVTGDISACSHSAVYLEGAPVITKGTVSGLSLSGGALITLGELSEGTSVAVSANGVFTEPSDNAVNYAQYFTAGDNAYRIVVKDNSLSCERYYVDTELAVIIQPALTEITAGFTAQLAVEAINVASYKWQYRRNENAPWVSTTMSGYKTDTLSVKALLGRNGYQYRCKLTGVDGTVIFTEPATLTVNDSITVTAHPSRQTVAVDANGVFAIAAEGTGLTYQWQYRKTEDGNWMNTTLPGCKTDTLTVKAILSRNGYQYRCAIIDENNIKIYTRAATLSTIGFTVQPEDQTVTDGETAVFTAAAKGQKLTYRWQYRKSGDGGWMDTTLTGYDTDTLSVKAIAGRNGYQYRCAVTDARGVTWYSDPATLTVTQ